jgi:3-isopropylmalate dehydrogenase
VYNGEKTILNDGTGASDTCVYNENEISRIAHLAYKAAKGRRGKLTLVDKADFLETSRLWRKVVGRIGESYPEVHLDFMSVEVAAMQIILKPSQFDVVLTENMFGEILSDEAGVIGGSIGLLPGASVGENHALFEPMHGASSIKGGKNSANPIASILCAAMMMEHFGLREETQAIVMAVYQAMKKNVVTPDLDPKGRYGTEHVGEFIANTIADSDDLQSMNKENIGLGKSTII